MKKNTNNAKKTQTNSCSMEQMEARAMFSGTAPAVVGYLPDYAVDGLTNQATGKLDKVDWSTVTQINYFAIKPTSDGQMPTSTATEGCTFATMDDVVAQAHSHNVKVAIVVGGANQDQSLTDIIDNPGRFSTFANNLKSFAQAHHFDQVDLDWEKAHPTDTEFNSYGTMISAVKSALSPAGIKLSAAVYGNSLAKGSANYPDGDWDDRRFQLDPTVASQLDQIGVMDYDLDFSDHSPVSQSEDNMRDWATQVGSANAGKLLMGVPFYGKAGYGWGDGENGSEAYSDLVDRYLQNHSTMPSNQNFVDAAFSDALGGQQYRWHFNSVDEIKTKTAFAMQQNYAGVMAWDLGGDHVAGTNSTAGTKDTYSLLAAIGTVTGGHSTSTGNTGNTGNGGGSTSTNSGSISGSLFYDGNWNGDVDQNELDDNVTYGMESGRTVWLDTNDNGQLDAGERTTTTDHDGKYTFDGLAAGTYHVCALEHAGYFYTTPRSLDVQVGDGQQVTDIFFGELVTYRHPH